MRIKSLLTIFLTMAALVFIFVSDRAEALEITKIIQGTAQEVKDNSVRIIEDSNGKEARITIDSNTVYDNVQKLSDIKKGDKLQIEYQEHQNKNIATLVTKLEMDSEDSL